MRYSIWERMNNEVWESCTIQPKKLVEFMCPTHFVGQVFVEDSLKAYCSIGVSVFINNVEMEVNFKVQGLIFCNIAMQKLLL